MPKKLANGIAPETITEADPRVVPYEAVNVITAAFEAHAPSIPMGAHADIQRALRAAVKAAYAPGEDKPQRAKPGRRPAVQPQQAAA